MIQRCAWANTSDIYIKYHDEEWGVPLHDDIKLFGYLVLEGAQAGLSWLTILKRRENYKEAFMDFDPKLVASFTTQDIESLLKNPGIIRNKLKIESVVSNAKRYLEIQKEYGSFNNYQWQFVDGQPIQNHRRNMSEIPAETELAITFSKDLIMCGFKFVGPKIIYAHMQATGMVNDHVISCFRYKEIAKLK